MDLSKHMTRDDLQRGLDECGLCGHYDFIYVALDYETRKNHGYAVVNFVTPEAMRWAKDLCGTWTDATTKITFTAFKEQGLADLVELYRNKGMMYQDEDDFKPALFQEGQWRPFPPPNREQPPAKKKGRRTKKREG